jgi:excisionase family DNA binding protein
MSLDEATVLLRTDIQGIEKLVAEGRLDPVTTGRHVRLERDAVKALASESR